jgi:chemosensory pili system protein ChpB (putative protein-glutamate methylesterase)
MADRLPAIALLFEDVELSAHLRDALHELGAKIVYEGSLAAFSREELLASSADIVLVNLDDDADAQLDRLYAAIDGDYPRLMFNDAAVTRELSGWDRARWARHLAAKLLVEGDVDPPRPQDARAIEPPAAAQAEQGPALTLDEEIADGSLHFDTPTLSVEQDVAVELEPEASSVHVAESALAVEEFSLDAPFPDGQLLEEPALDAPALDAAVLDEPVFDETTHDELVLDEVVVDTFVPISSLAVEAPTIDELRGEQETDPDTLAAELEALLAGDEVGPASLDRDFSDSLSGDYVAKPVDFGLNDGLDMVGGSSGAVAPDAGIAAVVAAADVEPVVATQPVRVFDLSALELVSMDEQAPAATTVVAEKSALIIEERRTEPSSPTPPEWDLVEHQDEPAVAAEKAPAKAFGIETLSAAEFLAPMTDSAAESPVRPGLSLELVSIEEAIAPRTDGEFASEMFLHTSGSGIRRLIVLGASHDSEPSVRRFMASLPARLPAVVLLAHHLEGQSAESLAQSLGENCKLKVKVATDGTFASQGEVLLVPLGKHVLLRRDGQVSLQSDPDRYASRGPSIDAAFTMAAGAFGTDVLAIVFAGHATDAVAGAQAVNDRGGRIWVEESGESSATQMVAGIREERIPVIAGDVNALSARLIEEFP